MRDDDRLSWRMLLRRFSTEDGDSLRHRRQCFGQRPMALGTRSRNEGKGGWLCDGPHPLLVIAVSRLALSGCSSLGVRADDCWTDPVDGTR